MNYGCNVFVLVVSFFIGNSATSNTTKSPSLSLNSHSDLILLVAGCSIGGVIIVLLFIVIFCLWKRSKQTNTPPKDNHSGLIKQYESQPFPQFKTKHFSNSFTNEMESVNEGYQPAPLIKPIPATRPVSVRKVNLAGKPYGEMGQTAASPFIGAGAHANRLCSITSISPTPSMEGISIAQYLLDERRASSTTIFSNLSQSRRDSGYVDVNVSHVIKKRLHSSDINHKYIGSPSSSVKQTTVHNKHISENFQPSSLPEAFRKGSTTQALENCKKAKETLPKEFRMDIIRKKTPRGSQYENVKVGDGSNESADDEHDYTPVGEIHRSSSDYNVVEQKSQQNYEVPQDVCHYNRQHSIDCHYGNLNVKVGTEYQNFDYHVPVLNPTAVDDENVYFEFTPDGDDSNSKI